MSRTNVHVVDLVYDILLKKCGEDVAQNYLIKIGQHYHGHPSFRNVNETVQIESFNNFWRNQLLAYSYDNDLVEIAAQIRTWLENPGKVAYYVDSFEKNWFPLVAKIGLFQ